MISRVIIILIIFSLSSSVKAQFGDEQVVVTGDVVEGKVIRGQNVREWIGNVFITQGDIKITCNKAIEYIAANQVELIGNVVGRQDTITIFTSFGRYYGNTKTAFSDSGIILNDGHIILSADNGYHFFEENRALFYDNVELFDKERTLISDRLNYFQDIDKAIATGNVLIADSTSAIRSDSLIHLRVQETTYAYKNVKMTSPGNNVVITGQILEDYRLDKYTKITVDPLLVKIDTSSSGQIDTLLIACDIMEATSDSVSKFIAKDSVKIVRGQFSSKNNHAIYFREEDKLLTYKDEDEIDQPILWYNTSQLLGDSVYIYLKENALSKIEINNNASIFSKSQFEEFRFDQITGDTIWLSFENDDLNLTQVFGGVLSIYYALEEDKSKGVIKSSANRARFLFNDNNITGVELFGDPVTEYHPEILVEGKEKEFTLPTFIIYADRPKKEDLLN